MKTILAIGVAFALSVSAADNSYVEYANNSAAIQRAYKEIKDQSSPGFQKLKDAIAKGDADADAVAEHYEAVLSKLDFLAQLRAGINEYNVYVDAANKALDAKADEVQDDADRQKQLSDIEAHKSYTATTHGVTDKDSYVVMPDGSIATVQSTAVSSSTTTVRENRATAQARAEVEKSGIQSDADKRQAKLQNGKLRPVTCAITAAQIKALQDGERTKYKYLLDKLK